MFLIFVHFGQFFFSLESGEGLKASRNSVLESTFVLVREGTITFEYKVCLSLFFPVEYKTNQSCRTVHTRTDKIFSGLCGIEL